MSFQNALAWNIAASIGYLDGWLNSGKQHVVEIDADIHSWSLELTLDQIEIDRLNMNVQIPYSTEPIEACLPFTAISWAVLYLPSTPADYSIADVVAAMRALIWYVHIET